MDGAEPPAPDPDRFLVTRARRGDQAAFASLVRAHQDRVYGVCLRVCGHEADARDAAQDAIVAAWRRLETFRGEARFSSWLSRIAVRAALDVMRAGRRRPVSADPLEDQRLLAVAAPEGDGTERAARAAAVRAALAALDEPFRSAVLLADVLGRPYDEIAATLGVALGTVKSRVARGRAMLATALEPERPVVRPPSKDPTT